MMTIMTITTQLPWFEELLTESFATMQMEYFNFTQHFNRLSERNNKCSHSFCQGFTSGAFIGGTVACLSASTSLSTLYPPDTSICPWRCSRFSHLHSSPHISQANYNVSKFASGYYSTPHCSSLFLTCCFF